MSLRGYKEGFQNVDYKPKEGMKIYTPLITSYQKYWGKNDGSLISEKKNLRYIKMRTKGKQKKRTKRGIIRKPIPRLIVPNRKLIRIKMSDYQTFTCTSGAISYKNIAGTDFLDPLVGTSAQQPLGFDQWKALYHTAYVVGTKVTLRVWNNQSTALMMGITAFGKSQSTTGLSDYEYYKEVPKTVSRLLTPDVDKGTLINKVSTKKHLSVRNILDNDTLRINLTSESSPSENYYFHAWVQPLDQATTLTSVQGVIDIEYLVVLTNPVIPTRSTN